MTCRKVILVTSLVLPSVSLFAMASPASATRIPAGTGTLTCSVAGGVSFSPPLSYDGTVAGGPSAREIATVGFQLTNCTGPGSNTPQPNPTAATLTGKDSVHIKDTKLFFMGHILKVLGACGAAAFDPSGTLKNAENWSGGSPVSKTHTQLRLSTVGGNVSGTSTRSYSGIASGTLNLTATSSAQYNSVCEGGFNSVSRLEFDPSTSTLTIGS